VKAAHNLEEQQKTIQGLAEAAESREQVISAQSDLILKTERAERAANFKALTAILFYILAIL
jgi:hypothetical protein